MDKLTITSFKQLLNDMSYEDRCEVIRDIIKEECKKGKISLYRDKILFGEHEIIYDEDVTNYLGTEALCHYLFFPNDECKICNEFEHIDSVKLEHIDLHSRDEILDVIKEDIHNDYVIELDYIHKSA